MGASSMIYSSIVLLCGGIVLRSSIPEYSQLRQVLHAQMKELYARGYVTYSNLCNKAFQDRIFQQSD